MKYSLHVLAIMLFSLWSIISSEALAAERTDTVEILFQCARTELLLDYGDNRRQLENIRAALEHWNNPDSTYYITNITIEGSASPEGTFALNGRLSQGRARRIAEYLFPDEGLDNSLITSEFTGRNWGGVKLLAQQAENLPYREQTLALLDQIIADNEAAGGETPQSDGLQRLKSLEGGVPYRWLLQNIFPQVRRTRVIVTYAPKPISLPRIGVQPPVYRVDTTLAGPIAPAPRPVEPEPEPEEPQKPFYISLHTNLALDAALLPNGGFDIYAGKGWSVHANWHYGWWHNDARHWWWRSYGGDLEVRRWFGGAKPLDGHHVGLYGQMLTYDFETGARGYLAPKWSWAAGVSYGYSLPLTSRLSLDFSVGLGYMGGKYYEYLPDRTCYVWQVTKQRHWFGPTKAEISLVWLIGRGNYNRKGGKK